MHEPAIVVSKMSATTNTRLVSVHRLFALHIPLGISMDITSFIVAGDAKQKENMTAAVRSVVESFDPNVYTEALESDNQVSGSHLTDRTDIPTMFLDQCRDKLWDMLVGLMDPEERLTGLHNDMALLAAVKVLRTRYEAPADAQYRFFHNVLEEFYTVLQPLAGAIERFDEAPMLAAASTRCSARGGSAPSGRR